MIKYINSRKHNYKERIKLNIKIAGLRSCSIEKNY